MVRVSFGRHAKEEKRGFPGEAGRARKIMPNTLTALANTLLDLPLISRIRRNHGLEHATLTLLAQRYPQTPIAGHSSHIGFWLLGNVPTAAVEWAVREALRRMKEGEHRLAIHPHCGTNFVASGTLAGLAGASAMTGVGGRWQDKIERLALAASLATLALILSQPLGAVLQQHVTTSGKPGRLEIVSITPTCRGSITAHQVITEG